jgi:hypothetical protein
MIMEVNIWIFRIIIKHETFVLSINASPHTLSARCGDPATAGQVGTGGERE